MNSLPKSVELEIMDYVQCAIVEYCENVNTTFGKRFMENQQVGEMIHYEFETHVAKNWWNIDSWMFHSSPKIIEQVFEYVNNLTGKNMSVNDFKNPTEFMEYVSRIWAIDNQERICRLVWGYLCENHDEVDMDDETVEYVITADEDEDDEVMENVLEDDVEIYRIVPDEDKEEQDIITYNMLPNNLHMSSQTFDELWNMIPQEYNYMNMYGKTIKAPRKYKVFGKAYKFTGMTDDHDCPIPKIIQQYLDYVNTLDTYTYNSVLINWYEKEDYIGFHADNTINLEYGSSIYGISFGEERTLRFKDDHGENTDYLLENNSIIGMHHGCQSKYKHSILKSKKLINKRINITFRCVN